MANLPMPQDIFGRLTLISEYENNQNGGEIADDQAALINNYQPHILTDLSIAWQLPEDRLAVREYRDATTVPANPKACFYRANN